MNAKSTYRIFFAAAAWALIASLPFAFGNAIAANVPSGDLVGPPYDTYPTRKVVNISFRATVLTGSDTMIGGIVINVPYGCYHRFLFRGIGPGLAAYHVTNPNLDPKLTVYAGDIPIATNDDWCVPERTDGGADPVSAADIVAANIASGAFKLADQSKDAALILTLGNGAYTVMLTSNQPGGIGLLEIYDLDKDVPGSLVNLSSRFKVTPNEGAGILGISFYGKGSCRMFIRAVGPSLEGFGVEGCMPDPRLLLVSASGDPVGVAMSKDTYTEDPRNTDQFGAFPIPKGTKDASLEFPVSDSWTDNAYWSEVYSRTNQSGVVLNEVYFFAFKNKY